MANTPRRAIGRLTHVRTGGAFIVTMVLAIPAAAAPPPSRMPGDIRQWIKDLDNDRFRIREIASHNLVKAGKKAIDAVAKAAQGDSLEVSIRAMGVLEALSRKADSDTAEAAKAVLLKLAASSHHIAAQRARAALRAGQYRIVKQLEQFGARVHDDADGLNVDLDTVEALARALPLLRQLPDLEHVSLSNPRMNDELMAELKDLRRLKYLNLYRSKIGDNGLKFLKNLNHLRSVPMGETKVTDAGLVHLKDLKQLQYIGFRGNNITDAGLAHLRGLTNLTGLYLGETKVTDAGLVHLQGMAKLNYLPLDHTQVSDKGLECLKRLSNLESLNLAQTKVTAAGMAQLQKAIPKLRLSTEPRSGTVPRRR